MKKLFTLLWLFLAAFSFKASSQGTSCSANFTVQFLNYNTVKLNPAVADSPAAHHLWNFGDGSPTSQFVSPTHTYALPGTYAVVHTLTRYNGTTPICTQSFTALIVITAPCNLLVDFSWTSTAANPLTLNFQNLSTPLSPADSITWNFGDNTSSHDINPSHTYANYGSYNICLIVKKNFNTPNTSPCIAYTCKNVAITTCNLVVDFSWTAAATNPLSIAFTNLSVPLAQGDSSTWSFGDGTSSNAVNPVHTYTSAGTYTVCLTVKKLTPAGTTPCIRYICKTIVVTSPCNFVVDFSWTATTANSLTLEFHNLTTPLASGDSSLWSFGDGTSSTSVNPVHTYTNPGTYTVCLTVKKPAAQGAPPCVRYICKTVVVTSPCNLVVDYSWNATATNPLMIEFHNLSTPLAAADSTIWSFGDGTSSYAVSPTHTYANAGTYTVCLIVKKYVQPGSAPCMRYICKTVVVTVPCNLVASFTWHPDSANAQKIWFMNTSTGMSSSDSIRWTFGDGTSSNLMNPDHTYAQAGTYTVCLRVQKRTPAGVSNCVSETCQQVVVQATCNFTPSWTWRLDTTNSNNVIFTNTTNISVTTAAATWFFGDGTSVNGWNATHVYTQPGRYYVCLRIQLTPNCVRYKCDSITVPVSCNFTPSWTWRLDSANTSNVIFTNTTIVPVTSATATWFFGDGTSANSWNASHLYAQPGRYYVCLRIQLTPNCVRYKCDSITVPVPPPPCNNQSNFNVVSTSASSQTFTFVPVYQNTAAVYTWTFGDGTGSHDMIATHHYNAAGTYTACLTVWRSANCASTTCKTVTVTTQINCDSVYVNYSYQYDPNIPNKVYFVASSNYPILDQTWTITKMVTPAPNPVILHQNNPYYIFPDTGWYRVCLRVVTLGGCVKEICREIHITQVGGTNVCQLQIFPNPVSSLATTVVSLTQPEMIYVFIYNSLNVQVAQSQQQGVTGSNTISINVANLVSGIYTMKVIHGNQICYGTFQKL